MVAAAKGRQVLAQAGSSNPATVSRNRIDGVIKDLSQQLASTPQANEPPAWLIAMMQQSERAEAAREAREAARQERMDRLFLMLMKGPTNGIIENDSEYDEFQRWKRQRHNE